MSTLQADRLRQDQIHGESLCECLQFHRLTSSRIYYLKLYDVVIGKSTPNDIRDNIVNNIVNNFTNMVLLQ